MTKEEFISRSEEKFGKGKFIYNYLPDVFSMKDKIKLICTSCGKEIYQRPDIHLKPGSSFPCEDCYKIQLREKNLNKFKQKLQNKYGDRFELDEDSYITTRDSVIVVCKKCGKSFNILPTNIINNKYKDKFPCPFCREEEKIEVNKRKFIESASLLYGDKYNYRESHYINAKTPVRIYCNSCGKGFSLTPNKHLSGQGCVCETCSSGEEMVLSWILSRNLKDFYLQKKIGGVPEGRYSLIDFEVKYNNKIYWIEYNGEQHYKKNNFLYEIHQKRSYEDQIARDELIKERCSSLGYIFIEIPFTYTTIKSIYLILDEIILHEVDPLTVIKLPNIEKL